jgi:hypothetical protein
VSSVLYGTELGSVTLKRVTVKWVTLRINTQLVTHSDTLSNWDVLVLYRHNVGTGMCLFCTATEQAHPSGHMRLLQDAPRLGWACSVPTQSHQESFPLSQVDRPVPSGPPCPKRTALSQVDRPVPSGPLVVARSDIARFFRLTTLLPSPLRPRCLGTDNRDVTVPIRTIYWFKDQTTTQMERHR